VQVLPIAPRKFRLTPWPFIELELTFHFPARHVAGHIFADSQTLETAFFAAPVKQLTVTLIQ
jgi:hypothetical protein